jgi:hypothetical protein
MCSICDLRIEFGTDHPMGLSVAVATRRAIEAGVIPAGADWDRERAIPLMHGVQQRLELVHGSEGIAALPRFFVLLVETRTWACFQPGASGFDRTVRVDPPDAFDDNDAGSRDAMFVAAETAFAPILGGKLPFETAVREGLLHLDAPEQAGALPRRAWSAGWPTSGYSRFVCV